MLIGAAKVLAALRGRTTDRWNRGADSATRSDQPDDASNRIFDGLADVRPVYHGPRFAPDTPVFAMGSCFAREIESALRQRGGNVISLDETIRRPEFQDASGVVRQGFFHRYTPTSMALEFRWPFGKAEGWTEDALLFAAAGDTTIDLNYGPGPADVSREATRLRRDVAGALVRKVREARIVIVTLGLAEGWVHLPTGLPVNAMDVRLLRRQANAFALHLLEYKEVMRALESIHALLTEVHADGEFHLFVTVSPVPFRSTMSEEDVIVANMTSKATLRAAAAHFARRQPNVHYFPSYELVVYSDPAIAWRPDRIHVERPMVAHIMDRFIQTVYAPGALPPRRVKAT